MNKTNVQSLSQCNKRLTELRDMISSPAGNLSINIFSHKRFNEEWIILHDLSTGKTMSIYHCPNNVTNLIRS